MKVQELFEYSTIPDLERDIQTGFPGTTKRQHSTNTIQVVQLNIIPYVGTKSLYFKGLCRNTDGGKKYDTQVFFGGGVEYQQEQSDGTVPFTATNGKEYHVVPLTLTGHNVRVRCSCPDFHYRFAHLDDADDSLWGPAPPQYQRKTEDRPSVNPNGVTGICKHIIKTVDALRQAGFVV